MVRFPTVSGSNLLRQKMKLPGDFKGELNLIFVAFQQWQQSEINSWIPDVMEWEKQYPGLVYYELPVIEDRNNLYKWFINEGMRAGIPNPLTRERTITLYLHKPDFTLSLEMTDEEHIYVLLLNKDHQELARFRGMYSRESADNLSRYLAGYFKT
ncbi:MAG: hypothetical protein GYA12_11765 [Chloroflexi bacterium]|nr:hypothetical protein [Chloroflexota bacterium]